MGQIFKMAFRAIGRNRRRSFFSALAISVGLALLMLMAAVINGELNSAIEKAILLQSGHLQVRAASYDENKSSLKWEDLVENPDQVASQIAAYSQVKAATPRLLASGFLTNGNDSAGARIYGIEPESAANAPFKDGMLSGSYLSGDDREGLLVGKPLADKLRLNAGDQVNLSINTSNGDVAEQTFTVRGIYSTGTYGFDSATVFLPLSKAQAITQTENHASTIFVLLNNTADTASITDALKAGAALKVLTWRDLNSMLVDFEATATSYISLFYLIVLGIVASVIINTLIMSVYERTREIGILMAIGMKGRRIMGLFLVESSLLAVGGVLMGVVLGILSVYLFNLKGFYIGNMGLSGFLVTDVIFAKLTLTDTINLGILTIIVAILAGLYPAVTASRMQPVEALRAEK